MTTRTRGTAFTTVQSLGGLLPADFLERVAETRDVEGMSRAEYHLAEGETLREAISRSWNRLVGAWGGFRRTLESVKDVPATTETRERWLQILFQELGYGQLQTTKALEIDGTDYPISHLWGSTPIHLLGFNVELDTRTKGVPGAARRAPHSMVQEFLNRSTNHLWALVSNGRVLRMLRDNLSMTRQAYVEFDLESMMDGEVYSDFVLLWLLCHQSRVEGERPETCWLERWVEQAQREGTRALERLHDGVEDALTHLGTGFLSHPRNEELRAAFSAGELSKQDYYRQLLRLVYRLLFLFVAEDRDVLLLPDTKPEPKDRYRRYYSTARLRRMAGRHVGSKHGDLWEGLRLVMDKLWRDGCEELALPPLGSMLWSPEATKHLDGASLENAALLEAVRALSFVQDTKVRRPIDFRNLGSEELGSVYESLLELDPQVDVATGQFRLKPAPGHERKVTGSYYTPTSLITELMNSALDPLLDERQKADDPEEALLSLKVCDPACGSGHFLIAAANRIAKRVATVRTGEGEPSPDEMRRALRDVIGRCIYGIDVNEMAVELCKVSLWLEALEPGKPLSFLDHRIACGNSLLGTTPKLLEDGISDAAFKALTGDDKDVVKALKKRNKEERSGQGTLELGVDPGKLAEPLGAELRAIDALDDTSIDRVREKEERWEKLRKGAEAAHAKLVADAWCAAFVAPKRKGAPPITQGVLTRLEEGLDRVLPETRDEIEQLAAKYRFLHWHLAFPDVFRLEGEGEPHPVTGWRDGFDLVCGNPPWERVKLSEKEFFATHAPEIASASGSRRKKMIQALKEDDPALFEAYRDELRKAEGQSHFLRSSSRYPLCGRGDVNLYAVFAEAMRAGISGVGRVGMLVPSGIATDSTTRFFFQDIVERQSLIALYDFVNTKPQFPAVDRTVRFCLLTLSGHRRPFKGAEFVFFAREATDLPDPHRRFTLTPDDIELLNPNTRTCPVFRSRRDAEITKKIYRRVPVLVEEGPPEENPWRIKFMTMFHMTNDSHLFRTRTELEAEGGRLEGNIFILPSGMRWLPLYEAKMFHHFDHRFGSYEARRNDRGYRVLPETQPVQYQDLNFVPQPYYWVSEASVDERLPSHQKWLLAFRDITRTDVERTFIASLLPRSGVGNNAPLILSEESPTQRACLVACLSSYAFDFVARQKVGRVHMNFFILQQLPVLPPNVFGCSCPWDPSVSLRDWVTGRVVELVYTSHDMTRFGRDLGYEGPPFRWDPERRAHLRAELDACFFHLYGLDLDEVDYIMDTFPIVRRKDEAEHDTYRTKELILERLESIDSEQASQD